MGRRRFEQKLNLIATIVFGLTTLFASLCGVVGLFIWLFRVFSNRATFSWFGFGGIITVTLILFVIGIIILKNGFDDLKRNP